MTWNPPDALWLWVGFNIFVLGMLALDLGVLRRHAGAVGFREALVWSVVWIALAMVFNFGVYLWFGPDRAIEFFTGYLIEKSLSVDNVFVFALIFTYFAVPAAYQHRVLFWGIIGALVMRAIMIFAGAILIKEFHWIIYIFGAFLVFTGIKLARQTDESIEPERNPLIRLVRRWIPVTDRFDGAKFFTRQSGKFAATPLFLVLIMVETTDLVFAIDSIPAIFAITTDPFIVYTSNVFAILGLRSLYFVLADALRQFHYLKVGLAAVLVFVGFKMLLTDIYKLNNLVSLGVVATLLAIAVIASLRAAPSASHPAPSAKEL